MPVWFYLFIYADIFSVDSFGQACRQCQRMFTKTMSKLWNKHMKLFEYGKVLCNYYSNLIQMLMHAKLWFGKKLWICFLSLLLWVCVFCILCFYVDDMLKKDLLIFVFCSVGAIYVYLLQIIYLLFSPY